MANNIVRQNNDIPWADFRDIEYGGGTLQVLRHEEQDYVAVPSMVDRNLVPPNRSAKQLEAFTNGSLSPHQIRRFRTDRNSNALNAIPLKDFKQVIRALDKKGVSAASSLLDALLDIALETIVDAAFGKDTKAEDVLAKLPEYFDQAQVARRCMQSSDPVVQQLAEFVAANPDFVIDNYCS